MLATTTSNRAIELKAFDDTKAGVKGLHDAGVTKIPSIFPSSSIYENNKQLPSTDADDVQIKLSIPIIDLKGIHNDSVLRNEAIDKVGYASEKWGFFQVVNHGIPGDVLEQMIGDIREFHEQDTELKKEFYTREYGRKVFYMSNYDLFQSSEANWKDTFGCYVAPDPPKPEEVPSVSGTDPEI